MRAGLLILACWTVSPMASQIDSGNAFRIHVVNSVTKTPIMGANVVLDQGGSPLSGRTDSEGVFAGRAQSSGKHLVTVTRRGYRITGTGLGKMVEIKAGADTDATLEMQPLGILAGRVLDQYGDPVRHSIVRTEDEMSVPGRDPYYESYASDITDDRGEYRIAEVTPGKHFVAVEYNSKDEERITSPRFRWPQTGGLILYPDATDLAQAHQVEVSEGQATHLNDVHIKIGRAVTISGRITPAPAGKNPSLSLQRLSPLALHSSPLVLGGESDTDGNFKIETLPGTFILTGSDAKTGRTSKPLALEVREENIAGLLLELTSGYEIHGRFIADGMRSVEFSKMFLNFGGPAVTVDGAGTFQSNLPGGKGDYPLQGLPEEWYMKDVVVAGGRITGRQIEIDPGTAEIVFTLSPRGAHIEIAVQEAGGTESQFVVLLPDSGAIPDVESTLRAERGPDGKFIVPAVPPGSYRVFTLDASNWTLLMNPAALMEKYRTLAPMITVSEGERKSIVVPAVKIPE